MAHIVMAYIIMAYIVMAYIVMAIASTVRYNLDNGSLRSSVRTLPVCMSLVGTLFPSMA